MEKKLTLKEKKEFDRRIPVCGICLTKFIPNPYPSEHGEYTEFVTACNHYPSVVARIGIQKKKRVITRKKK